MNMHQKNIINFSETSYTTIYQTTYSDLPSSFVEEMIYDEFEDDEVEYEDEDIDVIEEELPLIYFPSSSDFEDYN